MTVKKTYTIGIDFGAESAQAVLVNVNNGEVIAHANKKYPHGIISKYLPGFSEPLNPGWALHHPKDYLEAIKYCVSKMMKESKVSSSQVIGVGIDFQGSTIMPTTIEGEPLATIEEFKEEPHAWPIMWHHSASKEKAMELTRLASERFEPFLDRYGGEINPEWFFPKLWQIYDENSSVYNAADRLIEAVDWVVWQLTGIETRSLPAAGYKALWSKSEGFPLETFFGAMDPDLADVVDAKMSRDIAPIGEKVGELTEQTANWLGLETGTAVATGMLSPHSSVPAATIVEPGRMAMIINSNIKLMVLAKREYRVPGMSGMVEDGIVPGLIGFEAELASGTNHLDWFIRNMIPGNYEREARKANREVIEYIEDLAAKLEPAESGLVALDWWHGNRSILTDNDLTGLILGYSLETKPEELYRTIVESTTFGTRKIFETFIASGVPINEIIVVNNKTKNSALFLNILANVSCMEIKMTDSPFTSSKGSAMYAAVAATESKGGYNTIQEATRKMAHLSKKTYVPNNNDKKTYNRIYSEYTLLHDYFGYGHNNVMKRLRTLRNAILEKKQR